MPRETRNPAVASLSCWIYPSPGQDLPQRQPRSRRAPSATSSRFPLLSSSLTRPFNAVSHLGFKLASCRLGLLHGFASSLLGVGTIISLVFSAPIYVHVIKMNIALAFPFLRVSPMAFCCRLRQAESGVDISETFLFTSDFVNSLICNFLKKKTNNKIAKPLI